MKVRGGGFTSSREVRPCAHHSTEQNHVSLPINTWEGSNQTCVIVISVTPLLDSCVLSGAERDRQKECEREIETQAIYFLVNSA